MVRPTRRPVRRTARAGVLAIMAATVIGMIGVVPSGTATPSTVTIQAEDMAIRTVGGPDGPGWNIWSNGRIEHDLQPPGRGRHEVVVRARANASDGQPAAMALLVDGRTVDRASVAVTTDWAFDDYRFQVELTEDRHRIGVAFTNDAPDGRVNRDLVVDWISVTALPQPTTTDPPPGPPSEPPSESPPDSPTTTTEPVPPSTTPSSIVVTIPSTTDSSTTGPSTTGQSTSGSSVPGTSVPPAPPPTVLPTPGPPTVPSPTVTSPPGAGDGWAGPGDIAGRFYGNPTSGDHTGNSNQFRHSASRRFLAQRTGTVSAVTWNNRVLRPENIRDRASGNNVWAQCLNGGLDQYTCGYILSNSYSLGNGGRLRLELRADDGTAAHNPSEQVLARTDTFVPMDHLDDQFPVLELDRPVTIEAGQIYHLVFVQLNPPSCGRGLSVSEARNCDRDKGVVGLNGTYYDAQMPRSPFGGDVDANLRRDSPSEPWRQDRGELAWYGLRYQDGLWFGHLHTYYNGYKFGDAGGNHYVGGSDRARQVFEVVGTSYQVDGLWVRVDRPRSTSGTLSVEVRRGGTVLATGRFSSDDMVANCDDRCSGDWVYTQLSQPVTLAEGETYSVELSAPAGTRFSLQSGFPLDYSPYRVGESGSWWTGARAEFSGDGGRSWRPYSERGGSAYYPERDLSLVFTLVGGPRRLG